MKHIKMDKQKMIIIIICIVLLLLISFTIYHIFVPTKTVNGNRLENIVAIDDAAISKIKNEIIDSGLVNSVDYKTNVKTMKFFIDTDSSAENVKKINDIILNNLSEKITTTYDIEIYITNAKDTTNFPMIGYHSKSGSEFVWTLNKAGDDSEK